MNELADALINGLSTIAVAGALSLACDKAQRFDYPEYIDLGDFAQQLLRLLPDNAPVRTAATKILQGLQSTNGNSFVLANALWGPDVTRATGVSIYFPPPKGYAADYADLLFSKDGRWNALLQALYAT